MKKTVLLAILLLVLVGSIVTTPQIALHAAKFGFSIWWEYLFPVLLPIYMLISLCYALGLFHSLAYIIITAFRLPSITPSELSPYIYRWFMGATFIAPANQLSDGKQVQQATMQKKRTLLILNTLSYNANPIFIIVVVFTAFIPLSLLGLYIVICLLLATILCGLFIRFRYLNEYAERQSTSSIINALEKGRQEDGRPIGKLLGEGIYDSVQQLFLLGGVMLFSSVVAAYLQVLLPSTIRFQFMHIFEQHLATYSLLNSTLPFIVILLIIVFILSFGGLIQLFINYGLFKALHIRFRFFIVIRSIHALICCGIILLNYSWLERTFQLSTVKHTFITYNAILQQANSFTYTFLISCFICALCLLTLLCLSTLAMRLINKHYKNKQA